MGPAFKEDDSMNNFDNKIVPVLERKCPLLCIYSWHLFNQKIKYGMDQCLS